MRIRRATANDLPAASQLWMERIFLLRESDSLLRPRADAREAWLCAAREWLESERCAVFVAEGEGALAGFVAVGVCAGDIGMQPQCIGRLLGMALDLHAPHPALGSRLLERASDWLRGRGISTLAVDAPAAYPLENAFWRGQGAKQREQRFWLPL